MSAVQESLKPFALSCSSDFTGGTSDEKVTLTYIISNPDLLDRVNRTIQRIDLSSEVYTSEERTLAIKIPKSRLVSIDHKNKTPVPTKTASTTQAESHPPNFETAYATRSSLETAQKDKETGTNIPQKGHCTYLMMDQSFLQSSNPKDPNLQKLMDEVELIRNSDHFHVTAYNGYVVMVGTSERSGSSLTAMAHRFYRTLPRASIYLGTGNVVHPEKNRFSITGFPTDKQQTEWKFSAPPGVYLTDEFHKLITDPTKRDSALCSIEARYEQSLNLHKLTDFRPKASAKIGGPDRLIGKETELREMEDTLTNRRTKLTIVKGPAGIGKSRLIYEVLKHLPGAIYCSVDPFSKESNAPGYGLMTVAEQILDKYRDESKDEQSRLLRHPHVQAIINFSRKSQREKLDACTQTPEQVTDMCFDNLCLLNKGNSVFVLDDMHHTDRASIRHLTRLAYRYQTESGGQALIGLREEDIFEPEAVRDLGKSVEERFGKEAVKTISVTGLNFSDDKIARDFAFYSFKPEQREGKTLGHWYRKLGEVAGIQPWIMKTLMDGLLENPDENLEIIGDTILLKQDAETLIDRILAGDEDLSTYYRRRIRSLSTEARTLLQCIALSGGKTTAVQIFTIAREAAGLTKKQIKAAREELVKGRYVVSSEEETIPVEERTWELQHSTIRKIVIESIESGEEKLTLAQKLYRVFGEDKTTPADTKLSIALQIAQDSNAPDLHDEFWIKFMQDVQTSLEEARTMQTTGRMHQIATTAVTGVSSPQKILEAREALKQGQAATLPYQITRTIITALLDTAEAAVTLGRFGEAESCIQELEEINGKNIATDTALTYSIQDLETSPEQNTNSDVDMARAYSILFQKAYLERNVKQMKEVLDQLRETGKANPVQLATAEIKLAFREHRWKDVHEIYSENTEALKTDNDTHRKAHKNAPSPEYIEILRLVKCRSELEKLRSKILPGLDADVELQAGLIEPEHATQLLKTQRYLAQLGTVKQQHPRSFTPHCEIPFLEQAGITHAFQGNHMKALEALREAWRISNQVEFHEQEARIAKLIMDVLTMMAISTTSKYPTPTDYGHTTKRAVIDKKPLLLALRIRRDQGMVPLAHIPDRNNFFHLAIRANSIRIAGLLACAYETEADQSATDPRKTLQKAQLREELEEIISTAFEDFSVLNETSKIQKRTQEEKVGTTKPYHEDTETSYYVAPYMGHILSLAQKLGIEIPAHILNPNESPFMQKESLRAGFEFSRTLKDNGLGEIERKQTGYKTLAAILSYTS